jgi:hypothetical protein
MSMVRRDVETVRRRRKSRDALTSRPEVGRLLDAASAPASPRELAGEHAAADLFHRARLVDFATLEGNEMRVARSARTGLKAAVAAAGAVGRLSTGVAVAASGGHAPWSNAQAGSDSSTHAVDPTHPSGAPSDDASDSTGPDAHGFVGLCHAYLSGNKTTHGKALESPAFTALVTAAGGVDGVTTYCGTVTAAQPGTDPADHPSHPAHPTHPAKPTQAASPTHPAKPTQAASPTHPAHPTHPAEPTQAVSPTKPAHPTQGAGSSHGQ